MEIRGFKILMLVTLVGLIVTGRLIGHPANFAPVSAVAIFAAVYLGRRWGPAAALGGMFVSDAVIGFYDWRLMLAVYGSFALIGLLGRLIDKKSSWGDILGVSIVASLLFFFITNTAVWWLTPAYVKDLTGLSEALIMGLPFLKNTLMGDLFFTSSLFGLARIAIKWLRLAILVPVSSIKIDI